MNQQLAQDCVNELTLEEALYLWFTGWWVGATATPPFPAPIRKAEDWLPLNTPAPKAALKLLAKTTAEMLHRDGWVNQPVETPESQS